MAQYHIAFADVEPLLEGLAILGTGGGGSPEFGRQILRNDLAHGRTLTLIDPEDVGDEALIISGGYMGSVKALDAMSFSEIIAGWEQRFELLEAIKVTEELLGRKIDHIVPFEVGGLNCPVIMSACARLGIPCVNGDGLGRSAPETQMSSFIGHGISLTPMPLVDRLGNTVIVKGSVEPEYADELGRWVVTRGGGAGANNHYPMSGKQLKRAVIPETITGALKLGRAIMHARSTRGDPLRAAVESLRGRLLFTGRILELREQDQGGFLNTHARLEGTGPYAGSKAELVIKNEVMLCTIDNQARAIFPDLVCMLDPVSGCAITSVELRTGTELAAIGVSCHERLHEAMQTPVGAKAFSTSRFGYPDVKYRPLEELNKIPNGEN